MELWLVLLAFVLVAALAFFGAPLLVWTIAGAAFFGLLHVVAGAPLWLAIVFVVLMSPFLIRPIRRALISSRVAAFMRDGGMMPSISETERVALEAGTVWMDGELFSGRPDLDRLLKQPWPKALDPREQAFLDGPVEEACRLVDDFRAHEDGDFTPELWRFLKEKGFFGLIVPRRYGGHELGAAALSAVIQKLASRSFPLSVTVMIPNSLGPAELLQHYGTEEQKNDLLPKLASGEIVPCFALTEPNAGSDAGALAARGVVFRDADGATKLRLDWDKRYTSLAAVATLVGLAFKLEDPENLLGKGERPGITCALIPADTPGIEIAERHDPLGIPFYNSPMSGRDVVVGVDCIIGGPERAGDGWRMLMECLAAGRGIALPAACVAVSKTCLKVAGSYAAVRQQFGLPVGRFEGIEEPLARIVGQAYVFEAVRAWTCGAVDAGEKPSVVSAIVKYQLTEGWRRCVNDAMDVLAGAGISRGPRNMLANLYQAAPIPITVEGANILTRSMIVFGQGALRCHPWARDEVQALAARDDAAFDRAFFGHVGHVVRNVARWKLLTLTRGLLAKAPVSGPEARWWRRLSWASASFATTADLALITLGGDLKRREKLTGRLADALSGLCMAAATLRRFEADGRLEEDRPVLDWAMAWIFDDLQRALDEARANFPKSGVAVVMRALVLPVSRLLRFSPPPGDELGARLADVARSRSAQRARLVAGLFEPGGEQEAHVRLDGAHRLFEEAQRPLGAIKKAVAEGRLPKRRPEALVAEAQAEGVISAADAELVARARAAREDAVRVDAFPLEDRTPATRS